MRKVNNRLDINTTQVPPLINSFHWSRLSVANLCHATHRLREYIRRRVDRREDEQEVRDKHEVKIYSERSC